MRFDIRRLAAVLATIAGLVVAGTTAFAQLADDAIDQAFTRFFAAATVDEVAAASNAITKSGIAFDDVYARLKRGRAYSKNVPTGVVHGHRREYGQDYHYSLNVPGDYDPAHRYPVRIHLHGGVDARQI